jgi:hypothetical protein
MPAVSATAQRLQILWQDTRTQSEKGEWRALSGCRAGWIVKPGLPARSRPFGILEQRAIAMAPTDTLQHKFNDDLLINPRAAEKAERMFPTLIDVLQHPELKKRFSRFDIPANAAKKRAQIFGVAAVLCGVLALFAASAPSAPYSDTALGTWLGNGSALLGIASILIGFAGLLYARPKRDWLHNRLATERLRQFHFQTFVCRWPEILALLKREQTGADYVAKRARWFANVETRIEDRREAEFTEIVDDDALSEMWLHEACADAPAEEAARELAPMFAAYRELRIMHQFHYVSFNVRGEWGFPPRSPRGQAAFFSYTILLCVFAIFIFHFSALAISMLGGTAPWLHWLHVGVIWGAIVGLGVRTLEEGLQPEREIERYQQYRSAIRLIRDKFDNAATPAEKLQVMGDMERISFEEMRNFLRTAREARFII